ncbi:BQ5605_C022g09571 [Microbotryum silenes-dioicae]|uniref:BQ5605_C022g09571 protein n=1 Tax=Microbotryum silenes-dioicae TaxID=796604 RepID=A0A2X0ML27_9BASI|nr:BQ5605_C022g09571 [Microbotryum silenes-dioicae]
MIPVSCDTSNIGEEQLSIGLELFLDARRWTGHFGDLFGSKIQKNGGQMRSKIGDFGGFYLRALGWA